MGELQFQFQSFSEFWQMAGHGPYVWACYGITLIALVYLVVSPIRKRKTLYAELQRQARIEAHEKKQQSAQTDVTK